SVAPYHLLAIACNALKCLISGAMGFQKVGLLAIQNPAIIAASDLSVLFLSSSLLPKAFWIYYTDIMS
ncbi:hypothetical protein OZD67_05255, partial [Wolbachia endosymbiont of Drosophila nikananu]|uniref:hypothetical protein n=1 Tax=Wolbachia endosymbiont of Drosophila nikananu TaxID=375550 RepID=UPI0023A997DE